MNKVPNHLWNAIKWYDMHVIRVLEKRKKEKNREKYWTKVFQILFKTLIHNPTGSVKPTQNKYKENYLLAHHR